MQDWSDNDMSKLLDETNSLNTFAIFKNALIAKVDCFEVHTLAYVFGHKRFHIIDP